MLWLDVLFSISLFFVIGNIFKSIIGIFDPDLLYVNEDEDYARAFCFLEFICSVFISVTIIVAWVQVYK